MAVGTSAAMGEERPIAIRQLRDERFCVSSGKVSAASCGFGESRLSLPEPQAPGPMILLGPQGSRKLTPISWSLGLSL